MELHTAISRIKNALSSKDYISSLTHFHLKNGMVYATDGSLTASAPINEKLEHVVPAMEFEKALDIFGSNATYEWSAETLLVKKDRKRMTIRLLAPDQVFLQEPVTDLISVGPGFKESIKKIRPFISDDASRPWALTAWLRQGPNSTVWLATNNITVVMAKAPTLPFDVQIPNFTLDFILQREQPVVKMGATENKVSFYFDDNSQVTSQLFAIKMPDAVYNILNDPILDNPGWDHSSYFELTDEWRDAYKNVDSISPEEIILGPELMTARKKQATIEIECKTESPRSTDKLASHWNPRFLSSVVDIATHIDFGSYPQASRFIGNDIQGVVVGKVS